MCMGVAYKLADACFFAYPMVFRRCSCHDKPNGRTGQDHQYQGFNHGALGNVITLFGPQGMLHRRLRSAQQIILSYYKNKHKNLTMERHDKRNPQYPVIDVRVINHKGPFDVYLMDILQKHGGLERNQGAVIRLTVVRSIHLVSQRKSIGAIKLGTIHWWMKHWPIKQIWKVTGKKALICTIRVLTPNC